MSRIAELRSQIQPATGSLYERRVARLASIHLTVLFARLGITPNGASVLGLLCGAASVVLVAFGAGAWLVVGVLLLHLYEVLDCVDGELSRLTRRPSTRGLFLEDYSSYLMINGYYLAVGHRLHATADMTWALWAAVLLVAFGRNGAPVARRVVLSILARDATSPPAAPAPAAGSGVAPPPRGGVLARARRAFERISPDYINLRIVLTTVMLVELLAWGGQAIALPFVFAWYAALQAVREAGVVALQVGTDAIDCEVAAIRGRR